MSESLKQGDRVKIGPNARMYREIDKHGHPLCDGHLPTWADERGTVLRVLTQVPVVFPTTITMFQPRYGAGSDWVRLRLDHVTYPNDKPLEEAWVRECDLTKLHVIDALAELVRPHQCGNDFDEPRSSMVW